jgi:hypothetical protein
MDSGRRLANAGFRQYFFKKFQSSQVEYVRNIWPMEGNSLGVVANIKRDNDFQWLPFVEPNTRGFVEFERCQMVPNFTYQNTGNNTVQFTNTSMDIAFF